ncbi:MAG: polysaccharide deacetylase family protein, partial [Alphaproteobacteria bacterium]
MVSFTFDDFPKSAFTNGHEILARNGARGTYYVATALAGTRDEVGQMFDIEDVRAAHSQGHEVACHTHTHLNCAKATKSELLAQIRENASALASLLDGAAPTNFAYPYGAVSPRAKHVLGPRFSSCRGITAGINHENTDLADLCANKIYS